MTILEWLEGKQHQYKRGHWPDWIDVNESRTRRTCVECLKGRGGYRPPRLVLAPFRA